MPKDLPDGQFGPERYIEAQVWYDGPIEQYLTPQNPTKMP